MKNNVKSHMFIVLNEFLNSKAYTIRKRTLSILTP